MPDNRGYQRRLYNPYKQYDNPESMFVPQYDVEMLRQNSVIKQQRADAARMANAKAMSMLHDTDTRGADYAKRKEELISSIDENYDDIASKYNYDLSRASGDLYGFLGNLKNDEFWNLNKYAVEQGNEMDNTNAKLKAAGKTPYEFYGVGALYDEEGNYNTKEGIKYDVAQQSDSLQKGKDAIKNIRADEKTWGMVQTAYGQLRTGSTNELSNPKLSKVIEETQASYVQTDPQFYQRMAHMNGMYRKGMSGQEAITVMEQNGVDVKKNTIEHLMAANADRPYKMNKASYKNDIIAAEARARAAAGAGVVAQSKTIQTVNSHSSFNTNKSKVTKKNPYSGNSVVSKVPGSTAVAIAENIPLSIVPTPVGVILEVVSKVADGATFASEVGSGWINWLAKKTKYSEEDIVDKFEVPNVKKKIIAAIYGEERRQKDKEKHIKSETDKITKWAKKNNFDLNVYSYEDAWNKKEEFENNTNQQSYSELVMNDVFGGKKAVDAKESAIKNGVNIAGKLYDLNSDKEVEAVIELIEEANPDTEIESKADILKYITEKNTISNSYSTISPYGPSYTGTIDGLAVMIPDKNSGVAKYYSTSTKIAKAMKDHETYKVVKNTGPKGTSTIVTNDIYNGPKVIVVSNQKLNELKQSQGYIDASNKNLYITNEINRLNQNDINNTSERTITFDANNNKMYSVFSPEEYYRGTDEMFSRDEVSGYKPSVRNSNQYELSK